MNIVTDKDLKASYDSSKYIESVRENLLKTQTQDKELAREKLTDKRLKLKKRMRGDQGNEQGDEPVYQLPSGSEQNSCESQSDHESSSDGDESSVEEPPVKRQKI